MPGVNITCGNPACTNPTNTIATFRHVHMVGPKEWPAPAVGPTTKSAPFPQPCPDDNVPCPAISVKCNSCGWTKQYQVGS